MTTVDARPRAATGTAPDTRTYKLLVAATHTTLLLLLVQAVFAGQFVDRQGGDGWISAHGAVADAIWGIALLAAVYAVVKLRRTEPVLVGAFGLYFVATLVETGLGHLISEYNDNWAIGAHIPLAVALVALGGWIALRLSRLSRA